MNRAMRRLASLSRWTRLIFLSRLAMRRSLLEPLERLDDRLAEPYNRKLLQWLVKALMFLIYLMFALAAVWFLVPYGVRCLAERRLSERCREQRAIVLSYDDGPSETLTPRLLALLGARGVHASFFLLGRNANAWPELVERLLSEGHEVGNHSHSHINAWKSNPLAPLRDLDEGFQTLGALGAPCRFFRPPFGKITLAVLIYGLRRGLEYGWWTVDSRDSWKRRPIDDVISEVAAKGGGVVLMHDVEPRKPAPDGISHAEHLLALTARIIDFAQAEGYEIRRLGNVVDAQSNLRRPHVTKPA